MRSFAATIAPLAIGRTVRNVMKPRLSTQNGRNRLIPGPIDPTMSNRRGEQQPQDQGEAAWRPSAGTDTRQQPRWRASRRRRKPSDDNAMTASIHTRTGRRYRAERAAVSQTYRWVDAPAAPRREPESPGFAASIGPDRRHCHARGRRQGKPSSTGTSRVLAAGSLQDDPERNGKSKSQRDDRIAITAQPSRTASGIHASA